MSGVVAIYALLFKVIFYGDIIAYLDRKVKGRRGLSQKNPRHDGGEGRIHRGGADPSKEYTLTEWILFHLKYKTSMSTIGAVSIGEIML